MGGAARRLHRWARLLRDRGVAALAETITLGEGLAARGCSRTSDGERRLTDLRHVAPAAARRPRRPSSSGVTALARWLRRRIAEAERRRRRRGAQPPARVRRRGGPGADDPPQQGPRVPDRLLPVPVGARLHPARHRAGVLPRPRDGRPAHGRRRHRGPWLPRHAPPARDRAARRGPAARVRRAHARQASGGRLVGRRRGTAATRALGRLLFAASADGTVAADGIDDAVATPRRRRASRSSPPQAPGRISVEPSRSGAGDVEPAARAHPSSSSRRGSTARSTCGGGGPPTATSPPRRTSARVASEPEEPRARRRARAPTPAAVDDAGRRPRARPAVAARRRCRSASQFGTFVHRCSRRPISPPPTSRPSWPSASPRRRSRRAVDLGDPARGRRRAARGDRDAARPLLGGTAAARRGARRPARRARVRAAARRRR